MAWFKGKNDQGSLITASFKKGESAPMVWCRHFPSNHPYDTVEWFLCWARESDMGHQWTSQFLAMLNEGPWRSFRSKQLGNCWTWCSFTLEDDISHAKKMPKPDCQLPAMWRWLWPLSHAPTWIFVVWNLLRMRTWRTLLGSRGHCRDGLKMGCTSPMYGDLGANMMRNHGNYGI